jgi:hypothetical protein
MTPMEMAIEVQNNLEEACKNDAQKGKPDIESGRRFEWNDGEEKHIDIIPDNDRKGIGVYVYRSGKRTAQMALTLRAAVILFKGLQTILTDDSFTKEIAALDR